jgi:hypothetical protein
MHESQSEWPTDVRQLIGRGFLTESNLCVGARVELGFRYVVSPNSWRIARDQVPAGPVVCAYRIPSTLDSKKTCAVLGGGRLVWLPAAEVVKAFDRREDFYKWMRTGCTYGIGP